MNNTDSSVRVELEESVDASGSPVPQPVVRRNFVALGVAGAVALIVFAFVVLRPAEGETSAGTERATPTTTDQPLEAEESTSTTAVVASDAAPIVFEQFDSAVLLGGSGVETFVVLSSGSGQRDPILYRSNFFDSAFEQIPVELPDFDDDRETLWVDYSHLIVVDGELAMLRVSRWLPRVRTALPVESRVHRLLSADGQTWRIDDSFEPLDLLGDVVPVFHNDRAFGVAEELRFELVAGGGCENVVGAPTVADRSLTIVRAGADGPERIGPTMSQGHTSLPDGSVASLTIGGLAVPVLCDAPNELLDRLASPALELLQPDGSLRSITLPVEVLDSVSDRSVVTANLDLFEGLVLLQIGDVVWSVDPDTEEWALVFDRSVAPAGFGYRLKPDGWLLGIEDNGVTLTDLGTGQTEYRRLGSWDYRQTVFLDRTRLLVQLASGEPVIVNVGTSR